MKRLYFTVTLGVFASSGMAAQLENPVEVDAPIEKIYIPNGFDDNDNVQVVLQGNFPNTCYHIGSTQVAVDTATRTIQITAKSRKYEDKLCIQSITPFIQTVNLGLLREGSYKVSMAKNQPISRDMSIIRRKTESPDDFLYATVENANIDINPQTGKQALRLQGHFPMFFIGCMVIKEVRTYRDPVDVLVIQPITEIVNTPECDAQPSDRSFDYTAGLSEPFQGQGLLYVRTLHGDSITRYLDIK